MAWPVYAQSQDIPEYCLENEVTHRYLTEVQYKDGDYTYTKITDYYQIPTDYRKDQPAPVRLNWTLDGTYERLEVRYADSRTADLTNTVGIDASAESFDLYNLIPGRTYSYEIVGMNGDVQTTVKSGQFRTTGTVRMLKVDGVCNVRDLGGWTGFQGKPVPYGRIFRGGRLRNNSSNTVAVTESGKQVLLDEGIGLEIDLRTDSEANSNNESPLGSGVKYIRYNDAWACRIVTYRDNSTAVSCMQNIINYLKNGKSSYFHCSVGADRTGTVAFLALALLGVNEDQLSKDFELSSFYDNPEEVMLRMRTSDRYNYAGMMSDLLSRSGDNLQRKVYNYFKNGIGGTRISESDLDWYISYMMDGYKIVKSVSLDVSSAITLNPGEVRKVNLTITPSDATDATPVFSSSDEKVACVTPYGEISAVRGGTARISIRIADITKTITVNVPLVETAMPETIEDNGTVWQPGTNLIKNGSFEYAGHFKNWTSAKNMILTESNFDVKHYNDQSDDVYIQSRNSSDAGSIRTMWSISKGKTYAFGYKVKNTGGTYVNHNRNLETSLVNLTTPAIDAEGDDFQWSAPARSVLRDTVSLNGDALVFEYPSYDGEWTDVVYVFTNNDGYKYLQIWFSNLSQDGENTCFDSFFLTEVNDITVVPVTHRDSGIGLYYNLSGQEIAAQGKGLYIIDGKKYYNQ